MKNITIEQDPLAPPTYQPDVRWQAERAWLKEYKAEYAGEWVALDGGKLIAHGKDARSVYEAARTAGINLPLVVLIESDTELPFAGW